ncbi:MAG: hypothetical protein NT069_10135 [Planctomycetota bacterium]|nr:hypothetical protein [Planctomycetota bacterium]
MARIPRKLLFDPAEVGVYHCINRCVRRARLMGRDPYSGQSYDHRKEWLVGRMEELAGIMACEFLAFSVMDNHFHVVVRNRPDVVAGWSDEEVARRWYRLCPLRCDVNGNPAEPTEADLGMIVNCPERLAERRLRLSSLSWMMRFLTEQIARMANAEDKVSGRYWQGRFEMIRLLDEVAIAACMVYVDLNPIRAEIAQRPEESRFTSVYERILAACESALFPSAIEPAEFAKEPVTPHGFAILDVASGKREAVGSVDSGDSTVAADDDSQQLVGAADASSLRAEVSESTATPVEAAKTRRAAWLVPLEISAEIEQDAVPGARASNKGCLQMSFAAYLELLEWSGRQWHADKRGAIPGNLPPVFERLGIPEAGWMELLRGIDGRFRRVAGSPESMAQEALKRGRRYLHGMPTSRAAYGGQSPRNSSDKT